MIISGCYVIASDYYAGVHLHGEVCLHDDGDHHGRMNPDEQNAVQLLALRFLARDVGLRIKREAREHRTNQTFYVGIIIFGAFYYKKKKKRLGRDEERGFRAVFSGNRSSVQQ